MNLTSPKPSSRFTRLRKFLILAAVVFVALRPEPIRALAGVVQSLYRAIGVSGSFFNAIPKDSQVVTLIGDAGAMTDGVHRALQAIVEAAPPSQALVYLGDNIYPNGVPADAHSVHWRDAHNRLMRQIEPFKAKTGRIYFTPGNHDWENHASDGWGAVQRQTDLINVALGDGHALPARGCPGPVREHLFPNLQILALDSSWWMHEHRKPSAPHDGCTTLSPEGVLSTLNEMLTTTPSDVETIVILHHPLVEAGPDPVHTRCPFSPNCPPYADMRTRLSLVLAKHRPMLCASGHKHVLEVLKEAAGCRNYVISGGASNVHSAPHDPRLLFSQSALGFMLLHRTSSTPWNLDVVTVRGDDSFLPMESRVAYSTTLQ